MKVIFEIRDRNNKKSLWLNDRNIWDLQEIELTDDVKSAILNAFDIGCQFTKNEMYKTYFELERKDKK